MKRISVLVATSALLGGTAAAGGVVDAPVPGSLFLFGSVLLGVFGVLVAVWTLTGGAAK